MITLNLDWREVLWWMQGGMTGSHLRWSVYKDMVNKVWPQCSEQERRNIFLIMRRDLGTSWRPDGWNGHAKMEEKGEGKWKIAVEDSYDTLIGFMADGNYNHPILDTTSWMHFRQVLARFDPDNQYAVTLRVVNSDILEGMRRSTPASSIIKQPCLAHLRKGEKWESDTATLTVRTYKWEGEYRINWTLRSAVQYITKVEKLEIPDTGEM